MNIGLCIPLCDRKFIPTLLQAIRNQRLPFHQVLLLDSSPSPIQAEAWPVGTIRRILPENFDHGATRRLAAEILSETDILLFLTQDALPADPEAVANLVACFTDPTVGAAFGRQLPRAKAEASEAHARYFNYPPESRTVCAGDIPRLGLRAAFISNSFAAYRKSALAIVGGFPERSIVSEDMLVAARMLRAGWNIHYCAEARVFHSHGYSFGQEFRRYFDIGVFHAREPWLRRHFSPAEGEGLRFAASELKFLLRRRPGCIPAALLRLPVRYFGFRVGLGEKFLPPEIKARISNQKSFWNHEPHGFPCLKNRPGYSPD